MSEYGTKIRNYQAGSIFEYNNGVREAYDFKDAMLTNSLFSYFLRDHGMYVSSGGSTRDIVGINFDYGGQSYENQVKRMKKLIKETEESEKLSDERKTYLIEKYNEILKTVHKNKDKYVKRNAQKIREDFYENGVDIYYNSYHEGEAPERIHYKMLYRTPGKGKKGSCMFIREELYDIAREYLYMGIKLPEENAPIVEIGAYSSLVTSTIVGTVEIDPRRILVLKDVDSFFNTNVVSVEVDENKQCVAKHIDNYTLKNTLFDGQALIDLSIFPEWGNGYILLRQHFTKCAAFATDIQLFFRDYFGDKYETAELTDMWGNKILAKNVLLITTDNAIKWNKFDVSFDYWCEWVNKGHNLFGIVKTAHPSKYGDKQRMSYQMINALDINNMDEVMSSTEKYLNAISNDIDAYLQYLRENVDFVNGFDALVAITEYNPEFIKTDWFAKQRRFIVNRYAKKVKSGKLLQNADNLTIVGSPYAMLLYSVGEDPEKDDTLVPEEGTIQCWTDRFDNDQYLAAFRSPFNSCNNLTYLHNVHKDKLYRYFKFGKLIIAVNMIHTDMQDRNNGQDMDSDSIYTTNLPAIVEHARYCYKRYPTIVNNIPKEKTHYNGSINSFVVVDNNLSSSRREIGESSNLAQLCLSYTYSFPTEKKYEDYCAILAVLAQAAIDSAKRKFDVDITSEIARIKEDMHIDKHGYPAFWKLIKPEFNRDKINDSLICPMNSLFDMRITSARGKAPIPIESMIPPYNKNVNIKLCKSVESLIDKYNLSLYKANLNSIDYNDDDYFLLLEMFDELIEDIRKLIIGEKYIDLFLWLLNKMFSKDIEQEIASTKYKNRLQTNRMLTLKVLYEVNKDVFLKCFSGTK